MTPRFTSPVSSSGLSSSLFTSQGSKRFNDLKPPFDHLPSVRIRSLAFGMILNAPTIISNHIHTHIISNRLQTEYIYIYFTRNYGAFRTNDLLLISRPFLFPPPTSQPSSRSGIYKHRRRALAAGDAFRVSGQLPAKTRFANAQGTYRAARWRRRRSSDYSRRKIGSD